QTIQLVAKAAALTRDNLLEERLVIEDDWLPGMNAEILKRYCAQVSDLQSTQRFRGRHHGTTIINSVEISCYVHAMVRDNQRAHGRDARATQVVSGDPLLN